MSLEDCLQTECQISVAKARVSSVAELGRFRQMLNARRVHLQTCVSEHEAMADRMPTHGEMWLEIEIALGFARERYVMQRCMNWIADLITEKQTRDPAARERCLARMEEEERRIAETLERRWPRELVSVENFHARKSSRPR